MKVLTMTDFDKTEYAYKNGYTAAKEEIGELFNVVKAMIDRKVIYYQNKTYRIINIGIMNSESYYVVLEDTEEQGCITISTTYLKL